MDTRSLIVTGTPSRACPAASGHGSDERPSGALIKLWMVSGKSLTSLLVGGRTSAAVVRPSGQVVPGRIRCRLHN